MKQKKEWELWVENIEAWKQHYRILDKYLKLSPVNVDKHNMSRELGDKLKKLEPEDWPSAAHAVIEVIYHWQNNLHLGNIPDDAFENIPHLRWMGDILLHDGFIRKAVNSDDAFPYSLTIKGLLFYSLLKTLRKDTTDQAILYKLLEFIS